MQAPRELDLKAREGCYGASQLGALLDVDPNNDKHALYLQTVMGVTYPKTKRMIYGKFFEEAILYAACEESGKKFQPLFNQTFRHPEYPKYHLVATPDGLLEGETEGGVDCKLVAFDQRHQYGGSDDEIPPRVELQVRGCMAVCNRPLWYVAVWCGDRLYMYTVERDIEFEHFILEHAEKEWRRYFLAKVPPPIGGSKISADWLQRTYPKHKRPDLRPATADEIEQLRLYGKLKAEQKVLAKERERFENWFKEAIKDREGLVWDGGRLTWRTTKDKHWMDWESMSLALLTHYVKDAEARRKLLEDYTKAKPGTRRIWFKSDEFSEEEEATDAA